MMMADDDKPARRLRITKKPETETWINNKGQTCRRCKWCPGEMILKGT
jgi:hypothetical protein